MKFLFKSDPFQVIVITGIGRALAVQLAQQDATVVLWSKNRDPNEETLNLIKRECDHDCEAFAFTVDVSDRTQVFR